MMKTLEYGHDGGQVGAPKVLYILTAVLKFDGLEWHEKYITKLPENLHDQELLMEALIKTHIFDWAVIVDTAMGKRLRLGRADIFFTQQKITRTIAKMLSENKILPTLEIQYENFGT